MFDANKIKQHVEAYEDGFGFRIDVSERGLMVAGAKVKSIGMFVVANEYESDGDLCVEWDSDGLSNNADAETMGTLLMRNLHSNDDVTRVMNEFYWNDAFTSKLQEILKECGFSDEAVESVSGSEWGMQDEERASYDAFAVADEVRKAMTE